MGRAATLMAMTDAGRETVRLPELYAPWMAALLGGEVPEETRATCDDCVMAKPTRPAGTAPPQGPACPCQDMHPRGIQCSKL